jgi:hypothetical protein
MSGKFDAVTERLTILESSDAEEASDDTPDDAPNEPGEPDVEDTEEVEPEVLLSPEQIAEGLELFPTMTEEEQASFSAILETQAADIPYDGELDTPVTDGGDDAEEAVA